ncbi:MAG: sulfurtransferase TusA family protein [Anaerolineae bacterium]
MSTQITPNRTLDCRGLLCPMPIIRISNAIRELEVGQVLEMVATDPGSKADMEAWEKHTGHEILDTKEDDGLFRFYVRKTR